MCIALLPGWNFYVERIGIKCRLLERFDPGLLGLAEWSFANHLPGSLTAAVWSKFDLPRQPAVESSKVR